MLRRGERRQNELTARIGQARGRAGLSSRYPGATRVEQAAMQPHARPIGPRRAPHGSRLRLASLSVILVVLALVGTSKAQSSDDPVSRAITRIEATIDLRAEAAGRVLQGARLLEEAADARKLGEHERAHEALGQAERIALDVQRTFLVDQFLSTLASERSRLAPRPEAPASIQTGPVRGLDRGVRFRLGELRQSLGRILEEEKIPLGLLSVALVESGFNPRALSPKGARGMWQLMPATAARYGLLISKDNDDRLRPVESTRAAARYLRDLYDQFGDWKLALAAYNAGEGRVQRIIDRTGVRDFETMARQGYLPAETRRYVPAVVDAWSRLHRQLQAVQD